MGTKEITPPQVFIKEFLDWMNFRKGLLQPLTTAENDKELALLVQVNDYILPLEDMPLTAADGFLGLEHFVIAEMCGMIHVQRRRESEAFHLTAIAALALWTDATNLAECYLTELGLEIARDNNQSIPLDMTVK